MNEIEQLDSAAAKGTFIREVYEDLLRTNDMFKEYNEKNGPKAAFLMVLSFVVSFKTMLLTQPLLPKEETVCSTTCNDSKDEAAK